MTSIRLNAAAALVCVLAVAGCGKSSNPTQPSATASGSAEPVTSSVVAPRPLTPANGAQIRFGDQPVTLVVQNGLVTGNQTATYTFEVATDANFANRVQTKDGVAQGSATTSVRLDTLAGPADYYWHARAQGGGTTGVFSPASKFSVGPPIVVQAPSAVAPLTGAQTGLRPTLTVRNSARTGPAGAISYRFEIADNPAFNPVAVIGVVAENGSGQTSFTPATDLVINRTYYWRATATDPASNVSSNASPTQSFTTSLAIDLTKVIVSYPGAPSGPEVASWPQTAKIDVVEQDGNPAAGGPMCIAFTLSTYWPSTPYFGDPSVPIYANQWYFANIGGQWYGGPGEYLRSDRASFCKTGQGTNAIGPDGGWTGPMATWVPKVGELVGYMISTPARAGFRTINERSDVVLQPWRDTSLGSASAARRVR